MSGSAVKRLRRALAESGGASAATWRAVKRWYVRTKSRGTEPRPPKAPRRFASTVSAVAVERGRVEASERAAILSRHPDLAKPFRTIQALRREARKREGGAR